MTEHEATVIGLTLIAVAILWLLAFVGRELWGESRIRRAEAQWRQWFADLPETEKRAGAERLLDAVSETPIHDHLAAQVFHSQLADDERIWRRLDGDAS